MSKILTLINLCLLLFLVYMNFDTKNSFHEVMASDQLITTRIIQEEQLYSTLKADLTYLTSPKNLKNLANHHLNLGPVVSKQIVKDLEHLLTEPKSPAVKK